MKSSVQALLRKHAGSLAVRDLSDLVPRDQLISTENLTTLVVIVPKASHGEFVTSYESFSDLVVPRSCAQVAEDTDYVACTVVLFRRAIDDFKVAARGRGFQAKDLAAAAAALGSGDDDGGASSGAGTIAAKSTDSETALARLREELDKKRATLVTWCLASYGEAFSSWIHVTAVRLFVESILRYGLPPQFMPVLMHPNLKYQGAVRKLLAANFGAVGGHHFSAEAGGSAGGEDLFPYVSFTLNIEEV